MRVDLNFNGGFVLDFEDEDTVDELIERIEAETNSALDAVARRFNLGFFDVELQEG